MQIPLKQIIALCSKNFVSISMCIVPLKTFFHVHVLLKAFFHVFFSFLDPTFSLSQGKAK